MRDEEIRKAVRDSYAKVATDERSCCGPSASCRAGESAERSKAVGYTNEELSEVPDGANLGLGCGNPIALASLNAGDVVLDLGAGAGFDCFLAANRVGESGAVIGVDMTPEMIDKARENAVTGGYANVAFRLGELEHLPVADGEVDVVISNCVINLVPDKAQVFAEAFRALRPGGRLLVSDLVLTKEWPAGVERTAAAYAGCVAGAVLRDEYVQAVRDAGFAGVEIVDETSVSAMADGFADAAVEQAGTSLDVLRKAAEVVASVKVSAVKPG